MVTITPRIAITLYKGHLPIAWGHLDPGEGKTWLGVSVAYGYTRQGNGSRIVKRLCKFADNAGWELWLTCDKDIKNWYQRYGFRVMYIKNVVYMRRARKTKGM